MNILKFAFTAFIMLTFIGMASAQTEKKNAKEVDVNAVPVGGMQELGKQISKNLKYPKAVKKEGLSGRVFVGFTVGKDGKMRDFKVEKTFNDECADAAVTALKKADLEWTPAKIGNDNVAQYMVLPVVFELGEKDKKESSGNNER